MPSRSASPAGIAALVWLALAVSGAGGAAEPGRPYRGRPLVEVLRDLRDAGLDLVFSSAVVGADLRVTVEPRSTDPREALREILAPSYLRAEDGPGGSVLVLPATEPGAPAGERGDVPLEIRPAFVTELVVTPSRRALVREDQAPHYGLTGADAILVPTIGGDVSRLIELLPGVAAADNSAAFNVRGSVAGDVSLVLDGMELYDPFHLQSFQSPFSVIDTHIIDRIDVFGGGMTADFGDRHGGLVEMSTLMPEERAEGDVELGTLNSRFSYRAPFREGRASWLVSGRAWYPAEIAPTIELGHGEELRPAFGDLYGKTTFQLSPGAVLSAHGLASRDRLSYTEVTEAVNERVDATTENGYAWLRLLGSGAGGWMHKSVLSGGRIDKTRRGISAPDTGRVLVDDDRTVDFFGLEHDSTWYLSPSHALKAGFEVRRLRADYRYASDDPSRPDASRSFRLAPAGTSFAAYAAHRVRVRPALAVELGLRWDRQTYTDDNQLSPRLNAIWSAGRRSELRLALGRFHQSQRIHELRVEDDETIFGRAEVAEEGELSFLRGLPHGVRLRIDAYHRSLSELRPRYENLFEPIELFPETIEDRVEVLPSRARLSGVELFLSGDSNRALMWWASYARSSAEDRVDGRSVPRSWDQPHAVKILVGFRREDKWSMALTASAHTGWPTTPVTARLVTPTGGGPAEIVEGRGERNSDRFRAYSRFDFEARRSFAVRRGRLWLSVEIANLTDRRNPCCLDTTLFEVRPDGSVEVVRVFDHWLGFTPSASAMWKF